MPARDHGLLAHVQIMSAGAIVKSNFLHLGILLFPIFPPCQCIQHSYFSQRTARSFLWILRCDFLLFKLSNNKFCIYLTEEKTDDFVAYIKQSRMETSTRLCLYWKLEEIFRSFWCLIALHLEIHFEDAAEFFLPLSD